MPLDLRRIDRLEALFTQATRAGWLQPSEANALNFVAAAVRAREVGNDPPRLFVSLLRQRLGQNIAHTREERARLALVRFRELRPEGFRGNRATNRNCAQDVSCGILTQDSQFRGDA